MPTYAAVRRKLSLAVSATCLLLWQAARSATRAAHADTTRTPPSALAVGDNTYGQLGAASSVASSATPTAVSLPAGTDLVQVAAGQYDSYALTRAGGVLAWGRGSSGALGDGNTNDAAAPVPVQLPTGVVATKIAAGNGFALALTSDGKVYAWGDDSTGELGNGTQSNTGSATPVQVHFPAARRSPTSAPVRTSRSRSRASAPCSPGATTAPVSSATARRQRAPRRRRRHPRGQRGVVGRGRRRRRVRGHRRRQRAGVGRGLGRPARQRWPDEQRRAGLRHAAVRCLGPDGCRRWRVRARRHHGRRDCSPGAAAATATSAPGTPRTSSPPVAVPLPTGAIVIRRRPPAAASPPRSRQPARNTRGGSTTSASSATARTTTRTSPVAVAVPNGVHVQSASAGGQHQLLLTPLPPTVTHVSPAVAPTAGGTSVTLAGTNLSGATLCGSGRPPPRSTRYRRRASR